VRDLLTEARPEWLALAAAFDAMSCLSYVLMFRPVVCQNMPWRTGWGNLLVIVGALGYWAWDSAVLWAAFHALGYSSPLTIILMGYLIGQLPLPGGLGGIDGGLIGTLIVYGAPAAPAAAAVVVYRVILFWLPLLVGAIAFISLRRGLNRPDRPELCVVPAAT
jgi:uncharacterized protein (TIRG00374 family)